MLEIGVELWTSELVVISELGSDLLLAAAHRLQCCTNGKAAKANICLVIQNLKSFPPEKYEHSNHFHQKLFL